MMVRFSRPTIIFVFLAGLLAFGGWFIILQSRSASLEINGISIEIEMARTREEQTHGLSGRTTLSENRGMLFLYDKPGLYSFWMKDMRFPVDIIWIDSDQRIIDISKNALPESYPNTFQPREPAQYVLEVNAGFAEKYDINLGDAVTLPK